MCVWFAVQVLHFSSAETSVVEGANSVEYQALHAERLPAHRNVVSLLHVMTASRLTPEVVRFLPEEVREKVAPPNLQTGDRQYLRTTVLLLERLPCTLKQHLLERSTRITRGECVSMGLQLAEAVHHMLQHGVVHMDMKLENVMVADDGRRVVIIDFGSAKMTCRSSSDAAGHLDHNMELHTCTFIPMEGNLGHRAPEVLLSLMDAPLRQQVRKQL